MNRFKIVRGMRDLMKAEDRQREIWRMKMKGSGKKRNMKI